MANHRPKSLNELNQVYDKALQAQRAIKEGSQSLSDKTPASAPASENIFDELKQQAAQAKKPELYDADIANIANDFIKRFTQAEKPKAETAHKELKRPAPSIQSLYHTPVKPAENENKDIPLNIQPSFTLPDTELEEKSAPAIKPRTPESIMAAAQASAATAQAAKKQEEPAPRISEEESKRLEVQRSQHEVYAANRDVTPTVRITSAERNDLINEYMRVMSDEDDDSYFEQPKQKRSSFWSRRKKRRHEDEEIEAAEERIVSDPVIPEQEPPVVSFDASDVKYEAESVEDEEVTMNLYDYIEADFDFVDDEDFIDDDADEIIAETAEEAQEVIEEEPEKGTYPTEPEEGTYPTKPEEGTYPTEPEDIVYPTEAEEEIIQPIEAEEEIEIQEEPSATEEDTGSYGEEEASPTAGMVFDDIFSVTDESKRSYTGGNWSEVFSDEPEIMDAFEHQESYENEDSDEAEEIGKRSPAVTVKPKKNTGGKARKVILSLLLIVLIICTAFTAGLGSVIGVDTGKLFGGKYRAFSAEQSFALSGVNAGDLVITQDYNSYAAEGDSFVYVNHESQKFMIGKHRGSTYSISGDVLFIAENEAGRILVAREDTLGAVVATYAGIGSIASFISGNFIIITAVLLALSLIVFLLLIIPRFKKGGKNKADMAETELSETAEPEEYPTESAEDDSDSQQADEIDDDYDDYDYDTDGIEEGLFSGI